PNIDELLGQSFEFKIIKLNKRRRNIVVSRRVLLEAERKTKRDVLMKELQVGQVRKGIVKNITDFGAFIDLGGVDGLLHITDMSYGRVSHPSEMSWTRNVRHPSKIVSIRETIEAVVLKVDETEEKVSLGMKQTEEDPWMALPQKYPVGMRIKGKVRNLTSFGAFVEIEPGIDGLIHISDMSWTKRVQHPSEVVKEGQAVELKVLEVDPIHHRIVLAATGWPKDEGAQEPAKQDDQS